MGTTPNDFQAHVLTFGECDGKASSVTFLTILHLIPVVETLPETPGGLEVETCNA